MRKFESYPIYINHPGRWEKVRSRQMDRFAAADDAHMVDWLDGTGKRLYEIMEDKAPDPESREYEDRVYKLLMLIGSTRVGQLLFCSLAGDVQHWIIPLDYLDKKSCTCAAYEFPGAPKEGGGVRVYFNPTDFRSSAQRWFTGDDVLFHELIHAYRCGQLGYSGLNFKKMNEYTSAEEFIALHMQNVYLAYRGASRFYRSYRSSDSVSKGSAYQYFSGDMEVLMAFRYFLDNEPLAQTVASWTRPADSFNPWRDQPVLERIFLDSLSIPLTRIPAF